MLFLRRKREKFLEEELGESPGQVSTNQHSFKIKPKTQEDILEIISNQYLPKGYFAFFQKKNYGPCNPGGGQDDISKIISNQYLSKQILLTLQARWCLLEAVGTHGARVLCKNGENIMELYKILRNGGLDIL